MSDIAFCPKAKYGFRAFETSRKSGLWIEFSEPVGLATRQPLDAALRLSDGATGTALDCREEEALLGGGVYRGVGRGAIVQRWVFRCTQLPETVSVALSGAALLIECSLPRPSVVRRNYHLSPVASKLVTLQFLRPEE